MRFIDLHTVSWLLILLVGVVVIGVAMAWERARRKRVAAERRAAWRAHQDWMHSSTLHPPPATRPAEGPTPRKG